MQWKGSDITSDCVNSHSIVLSMLKSQKDMEEDNQEGEVDDWRKLISNPMTIFSDFINAK